MFYLHNRLFMIENENKVEIWGVTSDRLLELKKELANDVVARLLKKNPDAMVFIWREQLANYLVNEETILDVLNDKFWLEWFLLKNVWLDISLLKRYREMFWNVTTEKELVELKTSIFNEIDWVNITSSETQQSFGADSTPKEQNIVSNKVDDKSEQSTVKTKESTGWLSEKSEWNGKKSFNMWKSEKLSSDILNTKVDKSWFTPWPYPFKHITSPYKWIESYRVDKIKLDPLIWFSQLSLKWTEWSLVTLKVKDQKEHFAKKTAWYKKNNPCNISPYAWDFWGKWFSKVADWQRHAAYDSMVDWLASFMRLMRYGKNRHTWELLYHNKSIQWMNCSWMQWVYKPTEPESLKALRITWITKACKRLNVSPFQRLNTDDKETMMAWTQETAIRESWSYFNRETLEKAYKRAFW